MMADTIKTILVPATGDTADTTAFGTALAIARAFSAHIEVLHVRVDPLDAALAISPDPGAAALLARWTDRIERDAAEREAAAKRWFDDFRAREKVPVLDTPAADHNAASAHWGVGNDARSVAPFGMFADLIVAARGVEHDVTHRSVLETALIETGRPLLIPVGTAPRPIIGGAVAIAWKAGPQAVRAVAAAMPFLRRAADIAIMTVDEADDDNADRLVRNLAWHGLQARRERLRSGDRNQAETLLAAAAGNAGLLVMGGYGRSRLREWVFGGFTQRVLEEAPLPVLLAH
jgi:nucleotide-binding universal stress UspA family protein